MIQSPLSRGGSDHCLTHTHTSSNLAFDDAQDVLGLAVGPHPRPGSFRVRRWHRRSFIDHDGHAGPQSDCHFVSIAKLGSRGLPLLLAVAFLIASCGAGKSTTSGVVDLADAKPVVSITLPPGDVEPGAPSSVASGDFNGDGKTDLLVGAPYADGSNGTRPDAGEAYVIYGPLSGEIDLSDQQPDVRILGAVSGDNFGGGVAAGDLNGDGIDDIIVGAPLSNGLKNIRTDMGEAYVIFGGSHIASTIDTASVQQDFDLLPAEGFSHLGGTFAVGDVNGDGIGDLIVGAPYAGRQPNTPPGSARTTVGEVYVVYGSASLHGQDTVALDQEDVRLSGVNQYDQFGAPWRLPMLTATASATLLWVPADMTDRPEIVLMPAVLSSSTAARRCPSTKR